MGDGDIKDPGMRKQQKYLRMITRVRDDISAEDSMQIIAQINGTLLVYREKDTIVSIHVDPLPDSPDACNRPGVPRVDRVDTVVNHKTLMALAILEEET